MRTSYDWARYLDDGARQYLRVSAKTARPKNKKRHVFVQSGETVGLPHLKSTDVVWSLIPFAKLLEQHKPVSNEWVVLRKYTKPGVIGVKIPGGPTIKSAASKPVGVTLDEYIEAHNWVNDYLWGNGVAFSSFSWASEQLFRGTLKRDLRFYNPIGRKLMKTSRGICLPGNYDGPLEKWDIRGAYPASMVANAHRFPVGLKPIHANDWDKHDQSLILAYVYTKPGTENLKAPVIQVHAHDVDNPRETINWFWDFELRTILEDGHHLQPLVAFRTVTADLSDEIGEWNDILSIRYDKGRGFEGQLLKQVANSLWGSFVSSPIGLFTYKINGTKIELDDWASEHFKGRAGGEHVSSWVNALVSDRAFNEFLKPYDVLYFDTDGGYVRPLPKSIGNGEFGEWSFEGYANRLEIMGWQAYAAYTDEGVQVKLSGVPNASLQDLARWGTSHERHTQLRELSQNRSEQLIKAVHREKPLVSPLGSEQIPGRERFYRDLHPTIAPDISLFDVADADDIEVTEGQADALRRLSEFDPETEIEW